METGRWREVRRRVQAGANAWRAVEGLMTDRRISKRLKGKVTSTGVTPVCLSSSPSSESQFYVGSMYDDIRLHVARSYTSSANSPFSLMSSFTLSNHLLLGLPLFLLPCTFITIALLPT